VRWATLGSDPGSDRIALGVTTRSNHTWLAVWNGSAWEAAALATASLPGQTYLNVAVGFESASGEGLAIYGESANAFRYRTWSSGAGWSGQLVGPDIGGTANSMTLDADPGSNHLMAAFQDGANDLNYVRWDGGSWGSVTELENSSGETKNQPFAFLWDRDVVLLGVSVDQQMFSFGTRPLDTWLPAQASTILNTGNRAENIKGEISAFTDGSNAWTLSAAANGANQVRAQWSTTSASGPWTDISAYDSPFTIGTNVARDASVTLWVRIQTPTSTGSYLEHSSTLSISAEQY
jgi:hypothetical protein